MPQERDSVAGLAERVAREHALWPVPTAGARVERDGDRWVLTSDTLRVDLGASGDAASISLRDFDSESILALWRCGLVYLRDDASVVPASAVIAGERVVFRGARIGEYAVLEGGPILVEDTSIGSHSRLSGEVALLSSDVSSHCVIDGTVVMERTAAESFLRIYGRVSIGCYTQIGSHCSFSSLWRHPEIAPLGPVAWRESDLGLTVGASNLFGQGVHVLGSATRIGDGCVVAPSTVLLNVEIDAELVWGNPVRRTSVDQGLRGLSDDECFAAGRAQGRVAALLPIYGNVNVVRRDGTTFELSYPGYGRSAHPTSRGLPAFHRGALRAYFAASPLWNQATIGPARAADGVVSFVLELPESDLTPAGPLPPPARHGDPLHAALSHSLHAGQDDSADGPFERATEPLPPGAQIHGDAAADSEMVARIRILCAEYAGPLRARKLGLDAPLHLAGLDSLQIAELTARITETFGTTLDLFEENTLRRIAHVLSRARAPEESDEGESIDAH